MTTDRKADVVVSSQPILSAVRWISWRKLTVKHERCQKASPSTSSSRQA